MTFDQAIAYIIEALKFGINPGLEKISMACRLLSDPQNKYSVIQVTGTNGKTSVARLTTAILKEQGFKVGVYTSPHLSSYTERISVGGSPASELDFAEAVERVKPVLDEVSERLGELTEFEILTAAALDYFARTGVDVAVLEVGLGGKWDATSVSRPAVSVITNVDLDHTERLGKTIEDIARDKAHIIREGSVAICGHLAPSALAEVEERCRLTGTGLKLLGRDFQITAESTVNGKPVLSVAGLYCEYEHLLLNILGEYQKPNTAIAIAAVEALLKKALLRGALAEALGKVSCPGRMEIICREPVVLVDGAHNPAGIERLVASLKESFKGRRLTVVLSVSSDKDVEGIVSKLAGSIDRLILTQNKSYRSSSVEDLCARAISVPHEVEPDMGRAIEMGLKRAEGGVIVITGSLYAVGEARELLATSSLERTPAS